MRAEKTKLDKKRHVFKAVTWRAIGTIDTLLLGWLISGSLEVGAAIGGLEMLTKTILYYAHERLWYNVSFGVKRADEESI